MAKRHTARRIQHALRGYEITRTSANAGVPRRKRAEFGMGLEVALAAPRIDVGFDAKDDIAADLPIIAGMAAGQRLGQIAFDGRAHQTVLYPMRPGAQVGGAHADLA